MVKIRMKRLGRSHRAFYRLQAIDEQARRDGRSIEELGFFDPLVKDAAKAVNLKKDRIEFWLGRGAQPSDTVARLLKASGIAKPAAKK